MIVEDYDGRGRRAKVVQDQRGSSWLFRLFMRFFGRDPMRF
jgi:hypothetical protein